MASHLRVSMEISMGHGIFHGVGHGKFHGPKRKIILLIERKAYFNPVHVILSDKLYPIIITIFKKIIKIHLENPAA
jgi:hypothetical protein